MQMAPVRTGLLVLAVLTSSSGTSAASSSGDSVQLPVMQLPVECPTLGKPWGETEEELVHELCATLETSVGVPDPSRPDGVIVARESVPVPDGEEVSIEVDSTEPTFPEAGQDTFVQVYGDGSHVTAYFPPGSLVLNAPGVEGYNSALPIGILTIPNLEWTQGPITSIHQKLPPTIVGPIDTNKMTRVAGKTRCYQVSSGPGDANQREHAWMASCFHRYKPVAGDGSTSWNTRALIAHSSAHGGNWNHHLVYARNKIRVHPYPSTADLIAWSPTGTRTPGGKNTVTTTLSVSLGSFSGSVSVTHDIYPEKYGPQSISTVEGDEHFRFQWSGEKACGGDPCDYIGEGGGVQVDYLEAVGYSYETGIKIAWLCYYPVNC